MLNIFKWTVATIVLLGCTLLFLDGLAKELDRQDRVYYDTELQRTVSVEEGV